MDRGDEAYFYTSTSQKRKPVTQVTTQLQKLEITPKAKKPAANQMTTDDGGKKRDVRPKRRVGESLLENVYKELIRAPKKSK